MAVLTKLTIKEIADFFHQYKVGSVTDAQPADKGIENTNYFVTCEDKEYVLTLLERDYAGGGVFVQLLDLCVKAGLPVPPVMRCKDGEAIKQLKGKRAVVAERLSGKHVWNPTIQHCEQVGLFLGRFHSQTAQKLAFEVPKHERTLDWLKRKEAEVKDSLSSEQKKLMKDSVAVIESALAREDVSDLPKGIIHGDLFRDNVLIHEESIGVIDFYHAGESTLLFDLAVALMDWCHDAHGVLNTDRSNAMIKGYHRSFGLSSSALWFLPIFVLYAATSFWLSRLYIDVKKPTGVPKKNSNEMQLVVEKHLSQRFNFSQELLV